MRTVRALVLALSTACSAPAPDSPSAETPRAGGGATGGGKLDDPSAAPTSPRAVFYGNLGAWGSLGQDDAGKMYKSIDAVSQRFAALCQGKRKDSGLGDHLACQADLIVISPNGSLPVTDEVAERLVADHGARLSLDVRAHSKNDYAAILQLVKALFDGKTSAASSSFLARHPVGLSLDFEPQVVDSGFFPSAAWVNKICRAYRDRMVARGHAASDLECWTYEYGNPPMVQDGEKLDPFIYPVLMSPATAPLAKVKLQQQGVASPTAEQVLDKALSLKAGWVDRLRSEYASSQRVGCMFADAAYLSIMQRDAFTFAQGVKTLSSKCDVFTFQ